ncbi:hypothetical protein OA501_02740 [Flavobacteriaceae bacterium]|nr:hypothetical protein [Flavobacteriaceae bacterium]
MKKIFTLLAFAIGFSINAHIATNGTDNSGTYASAMGNFTTASGEASTTMGEITIASAYASTAMGGYTTARAYAPQQWDITQQQVIGLLQLLDNTT